MKGSLDFIGLNYYAPSYCKGLKTISSRPGDLVTERGTVCWPEGMYLALKHLAGRFATPIIVTESGVATNDETFRIQFMRKHLQAVQRAMQEDANYVLGPDG